jgi:hypothetical protein
MSAAKSPSSLVLSKRLSTKSNPFKLLKWQVQIKLQRRTDFELSSQNVLFECF